MRVLRVLAPWSQAPVPLVSGARRVTLRVATWNMDHWKRMRDDPTGQSQRDAWAYLQSLNVDVALVQEAAPPPFTDPVAWPVRSHPAPDRPDDWLIHPRFCRWGSGVVVFNPAVEFEPIEASPLNGAAYHGLWISHPGTWAGIRVMRGDQPPINLISLYGARDRPAFRTETGWYQTTVHRTLSDLTPLLDEEAGRWTVVAGDFNLGMQFSDTPEKPYRWAGLVRAVYTRLAALGLTDCIALGVPTDREPLANCGCGPAPDCRHVKTYRHNNEPNGSPWQNEHVFATQPMVGVLTSCTAVDDDAAWALSDHCR
jgi:hypothetical protein